MKIFNLEIRTILSILILGLALACCEEENPVEGADGTPLPENYGILEVDFKLPVYASIQKGIRRVDLALCNSMDEMYRGIFFLHINVSDAKQVYQINLPEGQYFYQAMVTCTCGGDSCIQGGFPYGSGGMKYALDKVYVVRGKLVRSLPNFQ